MEADIKLEIGRRFRRQREELGYTREYLGELCGLSPRFIANIEFGDSSFSINSLMIICKVLSCSADYLLFGEKINRDAWSDTIERVQNINVKYKPEVDKLLQALVEATSKAEELISN